MTESILIVEDEPDLAQLLEDYLKADGYRCSQIHAGDQVEGWLTCNQPNLILLDLMLPGKDGIEICRSVRASKLHSHIPVIMVTAKVEEVDRLLGLEVGADDYICKPFSPKEVVARVKAVLRRTLSPGISTEKDIVKLQDGCQRVTIKGNEADLTVIEFSLLKLLHSEPGKIFSRSYIMENIYSDYRVVSDRTVDSHIKKLRKKLQELEPEQEFIHSVYGAGYKYEASTE